MGEGEQGLQEESREAVMSGPFALTQTHSHQAQTCSGDIQTEIG